MANIHEGNPMETDSQLAQAFHSRYHARRTDLAAELDKLNNTRSSTETTRAGALRADIAALRKELADSITEGFIPSYDQRQYELNLKALEDAFEQLRAATAPKAKFSFKRTVAKPASSSSQSATPDPNPRLDHSPADVSLISAATPAVARPAALVLADRTSERLTSGELPSGADISLSSLSKCVVDLRGPRGASAVQIRDVSDSLIVLPLVHGATMIHSAKRCVLVVACQQFRMHGSRDVDVLLALPSSPIIEDSSSIRFAALHPEFLSPSNPTSASLESWLGSLASSSLPGKSSDEVPLPFSPQDFSHLRQTPSPHWSVLTSALLAARAPAMIEVLEGRSDCDAIFSRGGGNNDP